MKSNPLKLEEKMEVLVKSQRYFASCININKTAAASILKDAIGLRKQYQFFRSRWKINQVCKYGCINEVLHASSGIYLCETNLQETTLEIKNQLNGKYLDDSKAPKAWFEETSKTRNGIRERRLTGEAGYVPVIIVKARIRKI